MQRGTATDGRPARGADAPCLAVSPGRALLCLVALVAALGLLAGGAAGSDVQFAHNFSLDERPPTIASSSPVDDTTFTITIVDNHDVDEGTISADDFAVGTGSIQGISTAENGPNTTVTFTLESPVDKNTITLFTIGNVTIADTSGNILGEGDSRAGIDVSGMDSVPPRILSFDVSNATGGPATLEILARERLSALNVSLGGVADGYLTRSDFERDGTTYTAEYLPPADGTVRFTLFSYTDRGGNTRTNKITRIVRADVSPPNVQASVDLAASANLTLVFDGRQSTDSTGIDSYTWDFGDGTTATGQRVEHTFDPGEYTVTLEAVDAYGTAATDTISLNLSTGSGNVTDVNGSLIDRPTNVTVARSSDAVGADTVVAVDAARAGVPIAIPPTPSTAPALVRHGDVTLTKLNVTLAANRSFDLGISMGGSESVGPLSEFGAVEPLAGIVVVHAIPDRDIANVTFSLSVNRSRLTELGTAPGNVSLRRYHDGTWSTVPTMADDVTNTTVAVTAHAPGLSRFALTAAPGKQSGDDEGGDGGGGDGEDGDGEGGDGEGDSGESSGSESGGGADVQRPEFVVTNATLDRTELEPGETLRVNVTVRNGGSNPGFYTAGLALNGSVVTTAESPGVPPNASRTFPIRHRPNDTGTFPVSVNGTAAGTVTVSGGGGLFAPIAGVLSALPIPFGLLRPLVVFVLVPVVIVWAVLKGVALYLGY